VTRSPLHDRHVAAGATLTRFAGWELPLRFAGETAEHHAVRRAAGVFDLSHMGEIEVSGPGAAGCLDATLVGELSALEPGRARYTLLCDDAGGIVDDLVVYRLTGQDFLVVANASNAGVVTDALTATAGAAAGVTLADGTESAGEAVVVDATSRTALVAVQGPASPAILAAVTAAPVADLGRYGCLRGEVAGVAAVVGRTGYTGGDGFEIYLPSAEAGRVWDAVLEAGRDAGAVPVGLAARDTLRLEAGMALYGHELSRQTDPFEAGLGRLVAFGKPGDFVGRAALERRSAAGPRRRLVGVVAEGRRILRAGQALAPDDTRAAAAGPAAEERGEAARAPGAVTSGAWSPTLQRSVAMAYVASPLCEPGTVLTADVRGARVLATITPLPFVRRPTRGAST
jgi:aminomethyltransferase